MKIWVFVVCVLFTAGTAWADEPAVCKKSSECPANNVCTAEGTCVALPPQQPTEPAKPTKPQPTDAQVEEAKLHFTQGVVLFNDGNFSSALVEFKASYDLNPEPFVLKNIGYTQQRLFMYSDALDSLQKVLADDPNGPDVAEINKVIHDIKELVVDAKLTIGPPTAKNVAIWLDGKEAATYPLAKPLLIASGMHQLEVKADGYKPFAQSVTVTSGVPIDLKITLVAIPTTGKARINSPVPRAMVSIDGTPRGPVPLEVELPGGGHTLEITAPDHQTHRGELVITIGETRDVNIGLDKVVVIKPAGRPWYKKWYIVAPIGAVVVGAGVGTALVLTSTPDPVAGTLAPGSGAIR